jgi:hypothetical protein
VRPSENYVFDREYNFYEALRDSGVTAAKDAYYGSAALDLLKALENTLACGHAPERNFPAMQDALALLRKTGRLP